MKLLYVEDDEDFAAAFVELMGRTVEGMAITVACSFDEASRVLADSTFDAIVLDLAIPRQLGDQSHVEIGAELARTIASIHSATPILILTGQLDERETDDLHEDVRRRVRFAGGAERLLLSVKRKDRADRVIGALSELNSALNRSRAVPLSDLQNCGLGTDCPEEDRRLLRAFCVFRDGARGRVRKLSGGLSGGCVYRLDVLSDNGTVVQRCVVKVGSSQKIDEEVSNYERFVSRLPSGYPPIVGCDLIAGGARRAVFYNLAEGFEANLFDFMEEPAGLLRDLRLKLRTWHENRTTVNLTVRQLVEQIAGVGGLRELERANIAGVNSVLNQVIACSRAVQHGDLHGFNVLCKEDRSDLCVIDFGDTCESSGVLDAVTAELSPFFHPGTAGNSRVENSKRLAPDWFDDQVIQEAELREWLSPLRSWAREVAVSHLEFAAVVFAYCARQLKYPDTDHVFAIAVIAAAVIQLRDR